MSETSSADGGQHDEYQAADGLTEIRTAVEGFTATADQRFGQLDATLAELRGRLDRTETALRRPAARVETRSASDIETRAFDHFMRRGREAMAADEVRALRIASDSAGGYLVPDQWSRDIIKALPAFSPLRTVARVVTASSTEVVLPRRLTGTNAQWVAETAARPASEPTYGQTKITVHELATYVDVSNILLEDSAYDIEAELVDCLADDFGTKEAAAFLTGDGSGKPAGILTDSGLVAVTTASAGTVGIDDLISLYTALPSAYAQNGTWLMNRATIARLRKLKDSGGSYLLSIAGMAGAPATTLLGRPVIEAPELANVATAAVPVLFGDFNAGFRIFDRIPPGAPGTGPATNFSSGVAILRDPYSVQTTGLVRFHARRRVGGGVVQPAAIAKLTVA